MCDYRHDDDLIHYADYVLIGESGDYFVCEDHFENRTEEGKRGWQWINEEAT